jgi:hydrogenase maturation protein HypF
LDQYECLQAFHDTIRDLTTMYEISLDDLLVVHDCHPQYVSTAAAGELAHTQKKSVQHHRAHLGSVLAERGAWEKRVLGISLDGTGYGDDATVWGGEIFTGSISDGFKRVAHLRPAVLVGGDAAAQHPTQAAAGFLSQVAELPDLVGAPFHFPKGFAVGSELVRKGVRAIPTTSVGRLFDTAAALLGFTRRMSFEGQAAMWLEQIARRSSLVESYSFPFADHELDFRPLLASVAWDRYAGRNPQQIARAFHSGVAQGLYAAASTLCRRENIDTVVLSGGVFQNELLLEDLKILFDSAGIPVWTNHSVPANDGGISLGQAALAAFGQFDSIL